MIGLSVGHNELHTMQSWRPLWDRSQRAVSRGSGNCFAQGQQGVGGAGGEGSWVRTRLASERPPPGISELKPFTSSVLPLPSSCFQKQSDKLLYVEKFNVWLFQGELVLTENQGSEQKLQQGLKFNLLYSEVWKTKGSFSDEQKRSNLISLAFPPHWVLWGKKTKQT